jgi:hypothetical protein
VSDYLINHAKVGIPDDIEVLSQISPQALEALGIDTHVMEELHATVTKALPTIIDTCDELIRC